MTDAFERTGTFHYTPTLQETGAFLSRYCAWLMGCGATCIRIEKNTSRIAEAFGKRAEITIMPRHIHLSVYQKDNDIECKTFNVAVKHLPIDFSMNTKLSELSWKIADGKVGFIDAANCLENICDRRRMGATAVLFAVALANASFCRLFGGDYIAMAIVGIATLAGFWLKTRLNARHFDIRAIFIICAFVSAVLGSTGKLYSISATPDIALATSVLYLVPGIPFINSFNDMLYRHYICALSRFADALVLTGCLSIGLCLGMLMMKTGMF